MTFSILDQTKPWDAIVIGSGATGGWAAHKLARRGLSVLILEAGGDGPDLPTEPHALSARIRRKLDKIIKRRPVQSKCPAYYELEPELFIDDRQHPYSTAADTPFHWIRTRAMNGRALTWGGIGVRISDFELRAAEQDGFGPSWPVSYAELAPHFDEIDKYLPVYGDRDQLQQLPDGNYVGTPKLTTGEQGFRTALGAKMPDRRVIASRGVLVRPSARPNGEPGPPSLARDAVQRYGAALRTDAVVSHITVGSDGRATGVVFVDRRTGRSHEISAHAVALCASTLESTRILLNSTSAQHPDGLGNSSGMLGRNLMDHPALYLSGFLPGKRDLTWSDGTGGPKNVMIPRFHNLENRASGEFLRGYGFFGGIGRHSSADGLKQRCSAEEVPFTLVAYGEMLPRPENRVTLQRDNCDAWGIPTLHIECKFSANEQAMSRHMHASLEEMVAVAGGRTMGTPHHFSPGGFVHEVGTARMGHQAKDSVLNSHAQCWDADNVFVMDGAAWPTSAWQNPTFTMMAVAGRACDRLAAELERQIGKAKAAVAGHIARGLALLNVEGILDALNTLWACQVAMI